MDVGDVNGRSGRYEVRRFFLPTRAVESFTVIGPDLRPVELVDEYLAWLTACERSPAAWPTSPTTARITCVRPTVDQPGG